MNAITEFLNAYAGKTTVADELTSATILKIQAAYNQAYAKIVLAMSTGAKDPNFATFAKQTALLKQISSELDDFNEAGGHILKTVMDKIAKYSTKVAIKDLAMISPELQKPEAWHQAYNTKQVEAAFKDAYEHIAAQTDKMAADAKELLRTQATQIFRRAAVDGTSRKQAQKELKAELLAADPSFKFTDKAGRTWDINKYLEMLTRTVMHNTLHQAYLDTLTNEGHDLVKISTHGAKDECRKWEGKVISITGATPGYPILADLRASGDIFHPRCKHRMLAYHPDIDEIFAAVEAGKSDEEILKAGKEQEAMAEARRLAEEKAKTPAKATTKKANKGQTLDSAKKAYAKAQQKYEDFIAQQKAKNLTEDQIDDLENLHAVKRRLKFKFFHIIDEDTLKTAYKLHKNVLDTQQAYVGMMEVGKKRLDARAEALSRAIFFVDDSGYGRKSFASMDRDPHYSKLPIDTRKIVLGTIKEGTMHIPDDLFFDLLRAGMRFKYNDSPGRASCSGEGEIVYFAGSFNGATIIAHEVGHAVDSYLSTGSKEDFRWKFGGLWRDGKYVSRADGLELQKWFNSTRSNQKGTYKNGDGEYWKDNWIDNYEGRIYKEDGGRGVEWWSMNCQRYSLYVREHAKFDKLALDYIEATKTLSAKDKEAVLEQYVTQKRGGTQFKNWAIGDYTYEEARTFWVNKQRMANDWLDAKQRYPELTEFIAKLYGTPYLISDPGAPK